MRRVVDVWSPAIGAAGAVIALRPLGSSGAGLPLRARAGPRLRDQRHGRRGRRRCSTPGGSSSTASTLRRARPGPTAASRSRSGPGGTARTSRGSSTRSCRSSTTTAAAPPASLTLGARWAPTTRSTSRSAAPTCSRWRCASPATTTRPVARLGRAGRRALLQQPDGVRRPTSTATTWTGCARRCPSAARLRAGHVGGHHRRADSHPQMAGLLAEKGIPHELDLWGHDVPHDWPSWRRQLAHHLPRSADRRRGGRPSD